LPSSLKRKFDIVTCSENLGTNLFPARCFEDMLAALKPGGFAVFTIATKHLKHKSSFSMDYNCAIEKLIQRGSWSPVYHREFDKCRSFGHCG